VTAPDLHAPERLIARLIDFLAGAVVHKRW
jgi:hypothetical protein